MANARLWPEQTSRLRATMSAFVSGIDVRANDDDAAFWPEGDFDILPMSAFRQNQMLIDTLLSAS